MNITHNNNRYTNSSAYPQNKHHDQSALSSSDHNSLETNERNGSKGYNYNSCDSETPLFHRKEGASQFIIQREGSGHLKAFLEEADGSRFPILLKGFPERIASDKTDALRHLFAHMHIKRTGLFADLSCGLLGGMDGIAAEEALYQWNLSQISPRNNKSLINSALKLGEEELDKRPSNGPLAAYIIGKSIAEASLDEFKNFLIELADSYDWNGLNNHLVDQIRRLFNIEVNANLDRDNSSVQGKFERHLPSDLSQVKQIQEKLAALFLNVSANFDCLWQSFPAAQYALATRPSKVLKEMGIEKPGEYFFEALCKGHWEAIRDIQFMGVFDPGLVAFIKDIYAIPNTDCNRILSSFPRIAKLKEFLTVLRILTKKTLGNIIGLDLTTVDNQIESFLNSYRQDALNQDQVRHIPNSIREIFNTTSSQIQLIKATCQGKHYKNQELSSIHYYLDLIYSELTQAAFLVQVDSLEPDPSQNRLEAPVQIYKLGLIYEDQVKDAESYIKQIQDEKLQKYTYLELAKSAAIFNRLNINSAHENGVSYTEKIVKHFVKKAENPPEFAYYLLIKGAVEKIIDPETPPKDKELYEKRISEYLSKIGPLGNLAMFEIQKKNLSLKLNEANNNSIIKEFNEAIELWSGDYFGSNNYTNFINQILIPKLLNWSFSTEYIKLNLFIHKFFFEAIMEDQTITEDTKQAILAGVKDALEREFDSYYNLNIKPKLTLKLKRNEQFKDFSLKEKVDNNSLSSKYSIIQSIRKTPQAKLIQNYSPLVKKISEDTLALLKELCENIKQALGPPPTNFQIFTLGSLARRESGFYTDFEVGIALEKNSIAAQIYFEKFSQKLADSLFMLEEHPDVGMHGAHLDTADNAPPHKRFEFRDFSDDKIMKQIRNAMGYRRKDDIPTAGSRIYLLAAEDFVNLFKHNALDGLDASSIELSSFYNEELKAIKAVFHYYLSQYSNLNIPEFKQSVNLQKNTYKSLDEISNNIPQNSKISIFSSEKSLFDSEWGSELLRLAKKEIKRQLVEDYIIYKNGSPNQRYSLSKEALPYVKKILNPLTPREVGVARSVPELGRNLDKVYTYKEGLPFNLLQTRDKFFKKSIPCQGLGIDFENPSELGPLKQGQYISFKAMIELLNNKVSGQKLFTDTFDLSLDPKLPLHLIQKLNKGKAAKILPKKIDLKRAFYRIPEQILTGLSWFFRAAIQEEAQNPNEIDTFQHYSSIIDLLWQADVFYEELALEFRFLMNLGVKFRLQQQMKLKGECNEVYFHEETWRKELADQDSKIKILQESLSRWTCLYRKDASLENQNNYTDTLKNYLDALKKKAYLEKVGPDLFKPEEKMLFAQGFQSLKHIVDLTEKWIKKVKAGEKIEGLEGFPNAL